MRDRGEEVERYLALQGGLPRDHTLERSAVEGLVFWDMRQVRWLEFHSGERDTPLASGHARCAICGLRGGRGYRMASDHNHWTGLRRGVLCSGCNVSEGMRADGLAALYRERNPASILGHVEYYVGYGWPAGWWENERTARRLTGNPDWRPTEGA